jgi:hypothetical protein
MWGRGSSVNQETSSLYIHPLHLPAQARISIDVKSMGLYPIGCEKVDHSLLVSKMPLSHTAKISLAKFLQADWFIAVRSS